MIDERADDQFRLISTSALSMLVAASMIGAGVFTTSGFALADLGSTSLVMCAWIVGATLAISGAISYGMLADHITESGGEYLFLSRFVHPAAGFVAGWVSLLAGFTGAGAYAATAFESYALPAAARPTWLPEGSLAIVLVIGATAMHALNTRRGAISQSSLVAIKLSLLALFITYSLIVMPTWSGGGTLPIEKRSPWSSVGSFATSVMWISLSYSGFNAAIYVAGEAKDGARGVKQAMWKGTILVTVFYLLLNTIFLYAPDVSSIAGQQDIAAIAASKVGGAQLAWLVRIIVCTGLATSVSSILMAGPRVYAKMAKDGLFPRYFDAPKPPPTRSVLLQGAAIIVVVLMTGLRDLLSYLGLTLGISAACTVATLFFARQTGDKASQPSKSRYIIAGYYTTGTLVLAALAAWNRPAEALATLATILAGVIGFALLRRHGSGKRNA